jgi:hypothetical protein
MRWTATKFSVVSIIEKRQEWAKRGRQGVENPGHQNQNPARVSGSSSRPAEIGYSNEKDEGLPAHSQELDT